MRSRRGLILAGLLAVFLLGVVLLARHHEQEVATANAPTALDRGAAEDPRDIVDTREEVIEQFQTTAWAQELFQSVTLAKGAPQYEPGSKTKLRPFDDSDPEMQALMNEVYENGGCARPGEPCEAAAKLLRGGGDRLARYLIVQFTESLAAGYPNRLTYLSLIAYTNSNEGFRFVASRVRAGPDLDLADYQNAARALAHTGHRDAIPEAVRLLEQETDLNVLSGAINTLWRVPIATGELDLKVVDRLLSINAGELASCGRFCAQRALDGLFRLRDHFDLSELDDFEPANGRLPALWKKQ